MTTSISDNTNCSTILTPPTARPSASIVIYDGECRFCCAQVTRLARWDSNQKLSFISLHDPEVAQRWPNLQRAELMKQMYVVTPDQQQLAGAAAIRFLATQLPRLRPLSWLMSVPATMPIWNSLYAFVAKRRYWFGKKYSCDDGACKIPSR